MATNSWVQADPPAAPEELVDDLSGVLDPATARANIGAEAAGTAASLISALAEWEAAYGSVTGGYEFDGVGTSIPTGWSWVNQGGSTYVERLGAGIIQAPSSGSSNSVRGLVMQVPVAPFTVEAKLSLTLLPGNFQECGLLLRESSSGKVGLFTRNNQPVLVRSWWASPTSYTTGVTQAVQVSPFVYLRLVVTTWANVTYEFSFDGVSWTTWSTGVNVTTQMVPNEIGFCTNSSASTALNGACHWFRIRA